MYFFMEKNKYKFLPWKWFLMYIQNPHHVSVDQLIGQQIYKEVISKSKAQDGLG